MDGKFHYKTVESFFIYIGSSKNVADWENNYQKFYKNKNIENYAVKNNLKKYYYYKPIQT